MKAVKLLKCKQSLFFLFFLFCALLIFGFLKPILIAMAFTMNAFENMVTQMCGSISLIHSIIYL